MGEAHSWQLPDPVDHDPGLSLVVVQQKFVIRPIIGKNLTK